MLFIQCVSLCVYLPVFVCVSLCVYLPVCVSLYQHVCVSACPSVCIYLCVCTFDVVCSVAEAQGKDVIDGAVGVQCVSATVATHETSVALQDQHRAVDQL